MIITEMWGDIMVDIDHIYFDADCLLAESCLAIYEAIDQPNQTNEEQNRDNQNNQVNNKPTPPNDINHSNVQQHQQSPTNNNKPSNGNSNGVNNKPVNGNGGKNKEESVYGFTKADLDDPEKIKAIMGKAKKEKNLRAVKTVLRSAISLGAVAATTFAAAPLAVVSAASIAANLGVSLNDQKHNREMQQMITLIDSKISKTNGEMFTEKDPEKQKAMREYINALKQAKMKLRSA